MKLTLLAAVAALGLSAAPAASALRVGYNDDPKRFLAVPRAVEHSNTEIARVAFPWPAIEPRSGEFDWADMDRTVALFRDAGIRPIISILGSPAWAGAPGQPGIQCPCERAADPYWERMWQQVALRYPQAVLNVWNEPNLSIFGNVGVERMAELINEAAAAIRRVAPDRTVLGPPIAPVGDWIAYVRALYPRLDRQVEIAANLYPYARVRRDPGREQRVGQLRRDLSMLHRIGPRREIWITETNVSRYHVTVREQSRYVRDAYRVAGRLGVAGMIVHRLWSPFKPGGGVFAWDAGLSALAPDAAPTPLYNQIGRLHPGFRPLKVRPELPGGGIVTGAPPPPPWVPPAATPPCPESG